MKGVRVINGAVGIFDKIRNELGKGIEIAQKEQAKRQEVIEKNSEEHKVLDVHVKKANKVLDNLNKILE